MKKIMKKIKQCYNCGKKKVKGRESRIIESPKDTGIKVWFCVKCANQIKNE